MVSVIKIGGLNNLALLKIWFYLLVLGVHQSPKNLVGVGCVPFFFIHNEEVKCTEPSLSVSVPWRRGARQWFRKNTERLIPRFLS